MENTDKHWRLWGKLSPYRGVCYPQVTESEFWTSGETYVKWLLERLTRLYPTLRCETALDFGCGVGRILRPLAARYANVTGVDIAHGMLSEAKRNVPGADLCEQIPERQFDLVHSSLVLQHIAVNRGLEIVRRLTRCVAPGGVIALQAPVVVKHNIAYRVKHALPWLRFIFNAVQGKPVREPLMAMNAYPVETLCEILGCSVILPYKGTLIFIAQCCA